MPYSAYHQPTGPRYNRLPLTPPEYYGSGYPPSQAFHQAPFEQYPDHHNLGSIKRSDRIEYQLPPMSTTVLNQYRGQDFQYAHQVPVLPPIRTQNLGGHIQHQPVRQVVPSPKEEKTAGGVASELTYKMSHMVDFMSEMTTGMYEYYRCHDLGRSDIFSLVTGRRFEVAASYRKYVSQILTATRLPVSTLMLSMHYMTQRIYLLQAAGYNSSCLEASLVQMLTTSLMLASKFLDDNTFQNRSWAEVSQISVKELNNHELAWLKDMGWHLQFDVHGEFDSWLNFYSDWADAKFLEAEQARSMQSSMENLQLSQIGSRPPGLRHPLSPLYTPPSHHDSSFVRQNPWQPWNPPKTLSPPSSAVHSYPSTPGDWFKSPAAGFGQHSMAFSSRPLPPPPQILQSNQSPYGASTYMTYTPWSAYPQQGGYSCCPPPAEYNRYSHYAYGVQSATS